MAPLEGSRSPFQPVLDNRTDGATALFQQFAALARDQSAAAILQGLQDCRHTFPLMAVWTYALKQFAAPTTDLAAVAGDMAQQTRTIVRQGAAALQPYGAVVTLSNSSLVRRAILATGVELRVFCARSQPGGEGRQLAESLARAGIQAEVFNDGNMELVTAAADVVALGADQYADTGFINKVGSARMAALARQQNRPVLVLAKPFKETPQLPLLTPEFASLDVETQGTRSRQIVFEYVPWQPQIQLVTG